MSKKFLLGLGAVAGACFLISKKLTDEQKDKIAMKVDEMVLNGRDTALKYDQYARQFIEDNDLGVLKDKVVQKAQSFSSDQNVSEALDSLKKATRDLKEHLEAAGQDLKAYHEFDEDTLDDEDEIVINHNDASAFSEVKKEAEFEKDHPTETFYPQN